jgi:integrase
MKLYPPIIEGTIPAFYGNKIKVPYEMNKAVGYHEISGFSLKIKTVQSNRYLGDIINGYHTVNRNPDPNDMPMLETVKDAFLLEKAYQEEIGLSCNAKIDGFTNFIFINRFGNVQHQGTLNKAIRRIIRDCNDSVLLNATDDNPVLLPPFSCHSLRHTFTTRLCEEGVNVKVIQNVLGHAYFSTTMDIYADVTKDLKQKAFNDLDVNLS